MEKNKNENINQNLPEEKNEKPKIFGIRKKNGIVKDVSRRDFIALGLSLTAGVLGAGAVSSCGSDEKKTSDYSVQKYSTCASTVSYSHSSSVASVAVSPDGSILASGSEDCNVKLWSLPDGTLSKKLTGHTNTVLSLAISPDGTLLASGGCGEIMIWSFPEGELITTLDEKIYSRNSLVFSKDSAYLVSCNYYALSDNIKIFSMTDYSKYKTATIDSKVYGSLAINPSGTLLASGISTGEINIWDFPDLTNKQVIDAGQNVVSLVFCSDTLLITGKGVAATSLADCSIKVWKFASSAWSCIKTLSDHTRDVCTMCLNPMGTILVSGSYDSTIKLWNLSDSSMLKTLRGHGFSFVEAVSVTPDGATLISGGDDKNIKLWDISTGAITQVLTDSNCTFDVYGTCGTDDTNANCSCDTVCSCDSVCSCDTVCTCNSQGGDGGGGGTYWYPN